ncbi:tetratricopeptide repeat protein 36 homolog isoform X2 [Ostrea edulis]|uniref:tetratricopeptide repeat protein 36 homolog isoform X2 n=1 Tax=Ostrea edulis TaxID=37623 RepID=UPI0024AF3C26|nr:tetratricopeptide repeat protein 36 homolog isoform X2 [Ostrea edulis]
MSTGGTGSGVSNDHNHVSAHDSAVLNRIFNPNLPYGDVVDEEVIENDIEEETDDIKVSKQLEIEGVQAAESGEIESALNLFSRAIQNTPQRASGYNNRAQALRLKGDIQGALDDLNKAISLSRGTGSAACQAYTQRGLIYKLEGKTAGTGSRLQLKRGIRDEPYSRYR